MALATYHKARTPRKSFLDCPGGMCTSNGSVYIKGNWRMKSRAYSCGVGMLIVDGNKQALLWFLHHFSNQNNKYWSSTFSALSYYNIVHGLRTHEG